MDKSKIMMLWIERMFWKIKGKLLNSPIPTPLSCWEAALTRDLWSHQDRHMHFLEVYSWRS